VLWAIELSASAEKTLGGRLLRPKHYPHLSYEQQRKEGLREGVPEGREKVAGVRSEERAETPDHAPQTDCAPEVAREDHACPRLILASLPPHSYFLNQGEHYRVKSF